ncbi:sensor histidine kinase [Pseudoduganella sp.]|uniref:sensor histidine kinase n=1 Tax=Pseudoduganella sp. TaxID=1880898 RepID=UPI0035AEFF13
MSTHLYSARRRLVAATLICMLLIFLGIGIGARGVARHESDELFSARLATSARVLEALVARQLEHATVSQPIIIALPHELESITSDEPEVFGHRYETKIAFQVWRNDGVLLAKSASAPSQALAPLSAGYSENHADGADWQVFALRSGAVWVLAAEKDEVRQEMSDDIGKTILVPLAIGGVLMLAAVNFLILHNLRPLSELAARIAAREPESLEPLALPETPLEMAPIVTELNHLLDRIRAAFEREQRFLNAAAHEIRTPIAALQLHLENAMRAATPEQREASLEQAMAGARRTSKLAEQLLTLSRIAAGGDQVQLQSLSMRALCCDVIGSMEPLLDKRGQGVGLDAEQDCQVWGEPTQLRRLLQNLVDNASQHGAPHGEIQVRLSRWDQCAVLEVANDGAPIPEQEIDKLFTPYYRLPGAVPGGHGLGLAIVQEIVDLHHGKVEISRKPDGQGTVVRVRLPLART